ncbi:MAG: transketolase [Pseudomonadales bacterium RIFCSPLOWO2_12_60_38]|uniref:transketolase n=1 Tax=Pseudomonas TaxID=286 RepID=UPI0003DCD0E6|nr:MULTISPECIES: transketolase [unclassified Pseudomonas]ETK39145.1 transketolase [Pseudomonas fluorescens FH5]OHC33846.1 MAG: transketolase [Pseudomonadales bacterium RIFCSPLOWO2_12_60_38]OHC37705.1 MAG: transketolase [Pseudomonadales bacterium RIFCSPLOWO2_12_FULL_59_450]NHC50447.1 transketolase [Pseudomonas sp. AU8050]OJT20735.1 transketolase [Pseudomonas sp. FSL W5-0203]
MNHVATAADTQCINTLRTLAMDAVQKANSGHPGTPMGLAPVGYTLWSRFLRYHPEHPDWPNRDRFVLSVGHASMLLYSLLHLAGVVEIDAHGQRSGEPAVSLDDIKQFRQIGSKTPGHPEYRMTTGVETTTGPLGQGCANSVGMAMAERWLGQRFNRDGQVLFDYDVYTLCGDGDMMEGISSEAASLAGHLKLDNLCWIYDNNTISIEGHTELAFSEDVIQRFQAYGWHTVHVTDANDLPALSVALETFKANTGAPTLIVVDSVIGYGSPHKHNTAAAHGEPLGEDEIRLTKAAYGWPQDSSFLVPEEARTLLRDALYERAEPLYAEWNQTLAALDPQRADELQRMRAGEMPEQWQAHLPSFAADAKGVASRASGGEVLNAFAQQIPWLLGGSADLSPSTKTNLTFDGAGRFSAGDYSGRNLHFGIREHAMGAIANGMALSYLRPYTSTFLVFSDYMKPPIRLAAIMELPVIFVFTHDSIGVGEDGPTHQPIEHLTQLRATPGLLTLRPGDANETLELWKVALAQTHRPSCMVLSRQALPTLDRNHFAAASGAAKGAYVLADADQPKVILIATGSEVGLAVAAYEQLKDQGIGARVVSMPSWELFEDQDQAYRDSVLPPAVKARVVVEQAGPLGWDRYVGQTGAKVVMNSFGASAPLAKLQEKFGFTVENVVKLAKEQIQHNLTD